MFRAALALGIWLAGLLGRSLRRGITGNMIRVPVLLDTPECRESYLQKKGVPLDCMGDFSVLGYCVSSLENAERLLKEGGFKLRVNRTSLEVILESAEQNLEVFNVLSAVDLHCVFTDIAGEYYQA